MTTIFFGGNGFVGKNCSLEAFRPSSEYCDLLDYGSTYYYLKQFKGQEISIVNAAAYVAGFQFNKSRNVEMLYKNSLIALNLMRAIKELDLACYYLYVSSVCGYKDGNDTEDLIFNGEPCENNYGYGMAKRLGIAATRSLEIDLKDKVKICNLIPTNMAGPCFSEDTDILTLNGIKNIKEVKIGDLVYTLNPDNHNVEVEKVTNTQINSSKEFYNFNSYGVNFRVTPDHKIFYKTSSGFVKRRADYFKSRAGRDACQITFAHHNPIIETNGGDNCLMDMGKYCDSDHIFNGDAVKDGRQSKQKYFPLKYDLELFSMFIGWYVSEGYYVKNTFSLNGRRCGQVKITQEKSVNEKNWLEIDALLSKMKIPYGKDNHSFYFCSRLFSNFIVSEIGDGSRTVKLPSFIFSLPYRYRKNVFDCMMKGDGHKSGGKYTTSSLNLKNDFIHLCFTLGIKTGKVYQDIEGQWRIPIRQKRVNPTVKYRGISIETKEWPELVYCVTTEKNHIIYAGRKNVFNWIGQCDDFSDETSHFIPAIIKKMRRGDPEINVLGNANNLRDFLYVGDLGKVIEKCVEKQITGTYNVSSGRQISISDAVDTIKDVFNYKGKINKTFYNNPEERKVDNSKLKSVMEFNPTPLEENLKKIKEWLDTYVEYT